MNIHILSYTPFPEGYATCARVKAYMTALSSQGIDVKTIIPFRTEIHNRPINVNVAGEVSGGSYLYLSNTTIRSKYRLVRMIDDALSLLKGILYVIRSIKKEDCIILYDLPLFYIIVVLLLCKVLSRKSVIELCEYPYIWRKKSFSTIVSQFFFIRIALRLASGVIVISHALENFVKRYSAAKILYVPILVDKNIHVDKRFPEKSKKLVPFLLHTGSLYESKDGVCGMLEAFAIAKKRINFPIHYVLTGNINQSVDKDRIQDIIKKYSLDDCVKFVGYLKESELRWYQTHCSVVIINKLPSEQNKYCFSTKLGEYLLLGCPVITTNVGEQANYLKDNINSFLVEPGNPSLLAEAVVKVFNSVPELEQIRINATELAKRHFLPEQHGERMVRFFQKL